jgi:hypothetical protein
MHAIGPAGHSTEVIHDRAEQEAPRPIGVDPFVVSAKSATWYVSTEMARHIEACLEVEHHQGWISFVDLSGARVRLRSLEVEYLAQSTAGQRAAERAFHRALSRERKAERDWREGE